nr:HAD family hydrolase [Pseudalkalibacillus hwajinpoensis]
MEELYVKYTHIYFDLDNTLYDHEKAFKKTILHCAETMLHNKSSSLSVHKWFAVFKSNCDQFWSHYEKGEWSREHYQVSRFCKTNEYFDLPCSEKEAFEFQEEYQSKVASFAELYNGSASILALLKEKGIELGIITNGGKVTQTAKIEALQLFQWIPRENIYISEVIGMEKPGTSIFHYVHDRSGRYLYIGDTFEHDIKPALEAGFDAIYFNSRNEKVELPNEVPEIDTYDELKQLLVI